MAIDTLYFIIYTLYDDDYKCQHIIINPVVCYAKLFWWNQKEKTIKFHVCSFEHDFTTQIIAIYTVKWLNSNNILINHFWHIYDNIQLTTMNYQFAAKKDRGRERKLKKKHFN